MHQQKELNRLRHLLLGEDEKTIAEVRHWFKNPDYQSKGMSEVLADAIKMADHDNAPALSAALQHPVEEAVKHTIKDEPEAFSNLLPLTILPIQKSVFLNSIRLLLIGIFLFAMTCTLGLGFLIYQSMQTTQMLAKQNQKTEQTDTTKLLPIGKSDYQYTLGKR